MRKIILLFALISLIGFQSAFAQTTVIGTVTSADDGGTLPGVSVIIEGTSLGTTTDMDGNYSLSVPAGSTAIVFSFIGMEKQTIAYTGQTRIDVALETSSQLLDEIVVVGYGTTTKQSFTGTVKTIKAEELGAKSVSNVSQALAGEVSGVQVINTSGQPGTESTIRIRGFGSVNGNRDPLYVVDGVPFSGSINSINPADIETTTVLKDATATAIYGARGANGVILITTKKGKYESASIEVDVKTGVNVSSLPRYSSIKSPEDYIALSWEAMYNRGQASGDPNPAAYANTNLFSGSGIDPKYNMWNVANVSELIDPLTGLVRDGVTRKYDPEYWGDYGFQSSQRDEANVTISGGSDKTKYFSSFGYLNDVGYIINSDYKRYSTRLNVTHEVKPWLTGSANLGYSLSETMNNGQASNSNSIFWFVDNLPPIFPLFLRDETGAIIEDPIYGGNQYDYGVGRAFGALTNSIADATFNSNKTKRHELNGNFAFNVKFTEYLTFETRFGMQYYNNRYVNLNNPFYGSAAGQGGSVYKSDSELLSYNLLNLLRFNKSFGNHSFEVLAAHESNSWEQKRFTASMAKMVHPDIDDLNNFVLVSSPPSSWTDKSTLESYFGQLNYNFKNTYYFSGSVRRDGTSRFVNNKWDTFGSAGFSWIVSKESFMANLDFIEFLKYKISYGLVGEQAGVGFYPGYNTFNVSNLNDQISISPRDIGNPDLTWEVAKMFQTGVEFYLGNYVEAAIDYYVKNTDNLLFDSRVGPSVGYAIITVNDGLLRNSGLEFDVTTHIINKQDYKLDFTINGELLTNELLAMPIDPATGEQKLIDISGIYGRGVGHSLFDFYLREWAGVDPADGLGMWFVNYVDNNRNNTFDSGEAISSLSEYQKENPDSTISITTTKSYAEATQKYVGKSAIPKVRGAFRLSAKVKNFDITAQFLYSLGGYAYDYAYATLMHNRVVANNNWHTDIFDRWQEPGDITDVPKLSSNYDNTLVNSTSTRFLTSSNFLALNNIKINYNVPNTFAKKIGLSNVNIWVSGDNLFLLTTRDGFNPSTSETGSSDMYRYSPLSTYTAGVRVKF